MSAQLSGRRRGCHVTGCKMQLRLNKQLSGLPHILKKLMATVEKKNVDACCMQLTALRFLICPMGHDEERSEQRAIFISIGGVDLLIDILLNKALYKERKGVLVPDRIAQLRNVVTTILRELCYVDGTLAETLSTHDELLLRLFDFAFDYRTFDISLAFSEELLAARNSIFPLRRVRRLPQLIKSFSSRQMAYFCRIVSLCVSDIDERMQQMHRYRSLAMLEHSGGFLFRYRPPHTAVGSIADRNQALLLRIPCFLPRLVKLIASAHPDMPTDRWSHEVMSNFPHDIDPTTLLSSMGEPDDWDSVSDPLPPAPMLQMSTLRALTIASHHMEVMFVLSSLLGGKRKRDVLTDLARLRLLQPLHTVFRRQNWQQLPAEELTKVHGPDCQCQPDDALKVQLVRLLQHYGSTTDAAVKRSLLYSSAKRVELAAALEKEADAAMRAGQLDKLDGILSRLPKADGILSSALAVFLSKPADKNYSFSIACCLEVFARLAPPIYQLYLARQGLLSFLVEEIISAPAESGALQVYFDLLGELVKFNPVIFADLAALLATDDKLNALMTSMATQLIDSNMLLRSITLSVDHFRRSCPAYDVAVCPIAAWVDAHRTTLLRDLMLSVDVHKVLRENICCVNTACIMLILADQQGRMSDELAAVRASDNGTAALLAYRTMLWFWQGYYKFRACDCLNLTLSTMLPIQQWRRVIYRLCADDGSDDALVAAGQWSLADVMDDVRAKKELEEASGKKTTV
eukprot:PLAT11273.1.p1 GENE.PLAT11273.1~~PLAT11273.1.p1  ORF type:complete len:773 (-),score=458.25 PLAT11273.1:58-2289(-)